MSNLNANNVPSFNLLGETVSLHPTALTSSSIRLGIVILVLFRRAFYAVDGHVCDAVSAAALLVDKDAHMAC